MVLVSWSLHLLSQLFSCPPQIRTTLLQLDRNPPASIATLAMSAPLDYPAHTLPSLFQRQTTRQSSLHDAGEASFSSRPYRPFNLEKAETAEDTQRGNSTGAFRATSSGRISRIQAWHRDVHSLIMLCRTSKHPQMSSLTSMAQTTHTDRSIGLLGRR